MMRAQGNKVTRLLLTIFAAGLLIAGVSLTAAASMGGGFSWPNDAEAPGPTVVRDMRWAGAPNLDIGSGMRATFSQAPTASMVVTGPKNLVDYVEVEGGKVRINKPKRTFFGIPFDSGNFRSVTVAVTAPDVGDFNIHSGASMRIDGVKRPAVKIAGHSGSSVKAMVDVEQLTVDSHSGGSVSVDGKAADLVVEAHSGGSADVDGIVAVNARAEAHSGGSIGLSATGSADVEAHSGGSVELRTRPARLTTSKHSGGDIDVPS